MDHGQHRPQRRHHVMNRAPLPSSPARSQPPVARLSRREIRDGMEFAEEIEILAEGAGAAALRRALSELRVGSGRWPISTPSWRPASRAPHHGLPRRDGRPRTHNREGAAGSTGSRSIGAIRCGAHGDRSRQAAPRRQLSSPRLITGRARSALSLRRPRRAGIADEVALTCSTTPRIWAHDRRRPSRRRSPRARI